MFHEKHKNYFNNSTTKQYIDRFFKRQNKKLMIACNLMKK